MKTIFTILVLFIVAVNVAYAGNINVEPGAMVVKASGECTQAINGTFWEVTCPYSAGNTRDFELPQLIWPHEGQINWSEKLAFSSAAAGKVCFQIYTSVDMIDSVGSPTSPNFVLTESFEYDVSAGEVGELIYLTSGTFTPTKSSTGAACTATDCRDFPLRVRIRRDMAAGTCTGSQAADSVKIYNSNTAYD